MQETHDHASHEGSVSNRIREWLLFGIALVGLFAAGIGFLFSLQSDISRNSDYRIEDAKRVYEVTAAVNAVRRDLDKLSSECPIRVSGIERRVEILEEVFPTLGSLVSQVQLSNQLQSSRYQHEIGLGGMNGLRDEMAGARNNGKAGH